MASKPFSVSMRSFITSKCVKDFLGIKRKKAQ